jgi:hypothetical protein
MKKKFLVIIAAGLISCTFLAGCSGGQSAETKNVQTTAEKSTPPPLTTASPEQTPAEATVEAYTASSATTIAIGSEKIWLDIPIYPESKIAFSQTISNPNENFSKEARRTYKSEDDMTKVSAYYKSEMPKNGWEEISWKEEQGEINAQFGKNNKKDLAKINISVEKGQTYMIFVRYVPK